MRRAAALAVILALAVALVGCPPPGPPASASGGKPPRYAVELEGDDAPLRGRIDQDVADGVARIEAFFHAPFPRRFDVKVFGDRARLDAHWGAMWHEPDLHTECWMVGMGMATELSILSPARWRDQACEHDPDDSVELAQLITHELVHTYHSQVNDTVENDADAAAAMAWFVEGVAVLVSGQLERGHQAPAIEAIRSGAAPATLGEAWTGKYRYGVAGSLVAYVDAIAGRDALVRMLSARTPAELLAIIGVDEPTLLAGWRAWEERGRRPER